MKRILLALAILALVLPALRQAEARTDISIDFFYDNLGDDGNWIEAGDYGYCWQPSVAVSNANWRPYSDGYWAYTDVGWTWVSYEDFGWATYHYGRWVRLRDHGWVWAPGREWGPAWVSWRTGGDYVGWAPLPPRRGGDIYLDFSPITTQVDLDYDIGPAYYNFIDVRYIGEPVLRDRIFAADQNVTYISRTVNVTNITSKDSTIYNYGPDYNVVSRYSARPIQRLTLQREPNVDPMAAARSKSLMRVQGDKLVVAAPQQFQQPPKPIAPKVVKEKLDQAPPELGWEQVRDPKAQAQLREKMKKEDPKSVPPPTIQPSEKAEAGPGTTSPAVPNATVTPATTSNPATEVSATPATAATATSRASVAPARTATAAEAPSAPARDPAKDKRNLTASPAPQDAASVSPALSPTRRPEKNRSKPDEEVSPLATPATSMAPARDKPKNKRDTVTPAPSGPATTDADEMTAPTVAPKAPKQRPDKRKDESLVPAPVPIPQSAPRVAPPMIPESRQNRPAPDSIRPETAVEKPKHAPSELPPSFKKEQTVPDRVAPESANAPVNPPPARDQGKKKEQAPLERVVPQSENAPVNPPPVRDQGKKREQPPLERVVPQPENMPVNPLPPARDHEKKKEKNEPATSPTP